MNKEEQCFSGTGHTSVQGFRQNWQEAALHTKLLPDYNPTSNTTVASKLTLEPRGLGPTSPPCATGPCCSLDFLTGTPQVQQMDNTTSTRSALDLLTYGSTHKELVQHFGRLGNAVHRILMKCVCVRLLDKSLSYLASFHCQNNQGMR